MSEPSFAGQSAGPAADAARKRQLLLVGGVAAVGAVGVVAYFLLTGGASSGSRAPVAGPQVTHHAHASASPSLSPSAVGATIPAAYTAPVGHNPFKPLVVPPTQAASSSSSASPSASTSRTPTPTPTVIVFPSPTPTKAPSPTPTVTVTATPSPTGLPTSPTTQTLVLVDVDFANGKASVTVNGTAYQPKDGQVFATYFKLVSVIQGTDPSTGATTLGADFEYGDQFVQLAKGETAQLS